MGASVQVVRVHGVIDRPEDEISFPEDVQGTCEDRDVTPTPQFNALRDFRTKELEAGGLGVESGQVLKIKADDGVIEPLVGAQDLHLILPDHVVPVA
jgi:hypothetical protein